MAENLREIVFDTETTGFNHSGDDRIIEIGCVEMINHTPTGKIYHTYINPERDIPESSIRVHGLTRNFLSDKPVFDEIVDEFLEFIGDANLVAHNATFDMGFINAELRRSGKEQISFDKMVDTLAISRKKNPHLARHSLDALCIRYGIDNSHRDLHGALLDARILAEVYIELLGGKEVDFFKKSDAEIEITSEANLKIMKKEYREPRIFSLSEDDLNAHQKSLDTLSKIMDKKNADIDKSNLTKSDDEKIPHMKIIWS